MANQPINEELYFEVTEIKEIGEGMRVCLDFIDLLDHKDGLYVGNTGYGYIKVLSENRSSADYPPRPFRINCGAFHQYVFQQEKSRYLHEIKPGEELVVTGDSMKRQLSVGRIKIEKRPFFRLECRSEQGTISATLQKSSSVFLNEKAKGEVSILDLQVGDQISCLQDTPGRHLGEKIDETIIEK